MKLIALVDTLWMGHHPTWFKLYLRVLLGQGHAVWAICPRPDEIREWAAREELAGPTLRVFQIQELAPSPIHDPLVRTEPPAKEIRLRGGSPEVRLFGDSLPRLQQYEIRWRQLPSIPAKLIISDEVFASTADALTHWLLTRFVLHRAMASSGRVPDLVFFPKLDAWMQGALPPRWLRRFNLFPYPWSGVYFHPSHLYEPRLWPRLRRGPFAPESILHSRYCKGVAVLDETIADDLQARIGMPVVVFPDLADETPPDSNLPLAAEIRRRAAGRTVVGVLGGLDRRKNIFGLLEAAGQLPEEKWFFAFVGHNPFDAEVVHELEARASILPNCLIHPHRVEPEAAFNAVVAACDILFAVYQRFPFSSNMLAKAAAFRKRVLVSRGAVLDRRVARYRLGLAVPEDDPAAVVTALGRLQSGEPADPDFTGYLTAHSLARLEAAFGEILRILPR